MGQSCSKNENPEEGGAPPSEGGGEQQEQQPGEEGNAEQSPGSEGGGGGSQGPEQSPDAGPGSQASGGGGSKVKSQVSGQPASNINELTSTGQFHYERVSVNNRLLLQFFQSRNLKCLAASQRLAAESVVANPVLAQEWDQEYVLKWHHRALVQKLVPKSVQKVQRVAKQVSLGLGLEAL